MNNRAGRRQHSSSGTLRFLSFCMPIVRQTRIIDLNSIFRPHRLLNGWKLRWFSVMRAVESTQSHLFWGRIIAGVLLSNDLHTDFRPLNLVSALTTEGSGQTWALMLDVVMRTWHLNSSNIWTWTTDAFISDCPDGFGLNATLGSDFFFPTGGSRLLCWISSDCLWMYRDTFTLTSYVI